ncbi:MAG TPA: carboxypeptidase-like regulatory domain-containing protein [Candidatus Limnocylindrales bacterium]|nr:carboxypeptidase-like regulatory domain-containing protein [Candidatus Limnocylindrales bacterium]
MKNRLVATVLLCASALFAQTNRGSITGTVSDPSDAVIPGVSVKVTNLGTNEVRTVKTADNGTYSVIDLEPVTYKLEFEAQGFKKSVVPEVKVDTASSATVNMRLEAGSVDTKITVEAEAVLVNTESGVASNTITERQIQDVPLVNRSVLDLAMTLPNVSGDAGSENPTMTGSGTACPGCNLTIGGGRPLSNTIMADGTNNTGVGLGRSIVSFTPETVQEFTVQSSAFSAEYGTTGGGIISITTKSGTNELHGTALWYNRNPDFAAAPWTQATTNRSAPTLKYNQFSLSGGGPVYIPKVYNGRNKTFWFAAVEPWYRRDHLDQYALMPTADMWKGDFSNVVLTNSGWLPTSVVQQFASVAPTAVAQLSDSAIYQQFNLVGNQFQQITLCTTTITTNCQPSYSPFPGNKIPQQYLDSAALKAQQYMAPAGQYFLDSNGNISNLYAPRILQQDEKRYTFRVDHTISDKNRMYGRFTVTPVVKLQGTPVSPTNYGANYSWGKQAMIADTHTFSPTLFNDIRLNYTRGRFSATTAPQWDPQNGENLNATFGLPSITAGGLPTFQNLVPSKSYGNGSSTATGFGGAGSTQAETREERYALTDIVYKTMGPMSLKFGVDVNHALQNVIPLYGAIGGVYAFNAFPSNSNGGSSGTGGGSFASFLLGVPNNGGSPAVTLRNMEVPYYYRWNNGAGFIQNDWHVKPNLTLNLGLRYVIQLPRTEKYNDQGVFRPDLAKNYPLATPLALQDGETINSVNVVPFAFAGLGGNSRYLTPPQWTDFEPRFGFAWSPARLQSRHIVFRGGWGMSHAPITGITQLPNPDFGATYTATVYPTATVGSQTANPTYVMRLGENPPVLTPTSIRTQVYGPNGPPASGLDYLDSLYYQQTLGGYAVSNNYHTPYVNNWNFTSSWQANKNTLVELAYTGSMGIHLFMPAENINPKDSDLLSAQIGQNVSSTGTITDPLGRTNLITGKGLTVQNGTLGSPYLGFSTLNLLYDSSANSIRHAGYVNVVHRTGRGLTFYANYTLAKSIDTASSAGVDKGILSTGQVGGQVAFGGTRQGDRAVSLYDQKHVIHGTAIYDLPFGRGRQFGRNMWKPLDYAAGGWTLTGLVRINSGTPFTDYLSDTNQLGDTTHTIRPDMLTGVPVKNPLYDPNCPTGTGCQPYANPSAFMRPALGILGNAPRAVDGLRGPWQQFLDVSIQKSFRLGERGRKQLQFRVDALNILNHPVFAFIPNAGGGSDFMGAPSTATLTTAAYNSWATANGQPLQSTTAGAAVYNNIVAMVNAQKDAAGALPANFYRVPLPANFYGTSANSYDITTLSGYKNYQLRNAYSTSFGNLYQQGSSRYLQFGVKFYF